MKTRKLQIITLAMSLFIVLSFNFGRVLAVPVTCSDGTTVDLPAGKTQAEVCTKGVDPSLLDVPKGDLSNDTLKSVLQLVTGFIGSISFLIIVLAGLKYVLSRGNPDEISKSKDTILYALVGLLLSMSALGIITFVMGRF